MTNQKTKVIATRVSQDFAEILETLVKRDAFLNISDLLRDALRARIRCESPQLFDQFLEIAENEH